MEYRFSMTPRLLGLGILCLLMILIFLFLLGVQIGKRMGGHDAAAVIGEKIQNQQEFISSELNQAKNSVSAAAEAKKSVIEKSLP